MQSFFNKRKLNVKLSQILLSHKIDDYRSGTDIASLDQRWAGIIGGGGGAP